MGPVDFGGVDGGLDERSFVVVLFYFHHWALRPGFRVRSAEPPALEASCEADEVVGVQREDEGHDDPAEDGMGVVFVCTRRKESQLSCWKAVEENAQRLGVRLPYIAPKSMPRSEVTRKAPWGMSAS